MSQWIIAESWFELRVPLWRGNLVSDQCWWNNCLLSLIFEDSMSGAEFSAPHGVELGVLASLEQSKPPFRDNLLSLPPSPSIHSIYSSFLQLSLFTMASLQKVVISLLLIITAGFLFLAQTSSAAKGPLITSKVG